ncbi:hypothetical protein L420_01596 [Enterobacter hormaechei subsp. hoffmannii UCICRE 9]|nr:hypothetical protein L420_01596 [Enterobacter hormaechei subsp. hoffmannii UCICRE 9]
MFDIHLGAYIIHDQSEALLKRLELRGHRM